MTWGLTGPDPAPGDPGAYSRLSRDLSDTAEAAEASFRQLQRLAAGVDETIWAGQAAEAFAEELAELPPQLEKLGRSYALASSAMATYGRVMEDLQHRAAAAAARFEAASAEEAEGRRARDQALLERIAEDRRAAESRAVAGLQSASDAGIDNDPWYARAFDAVDSWVDDHAGILEEISSALQVVSGIAGVLSFFPVLAPIFAPIALASGALALGIDAARVATGNGSWTSLAVDLGLMALPGLGRLAHSGLASAGGGARTVGLADEAVSILPSSGRTFVGTPRGTVYDTPQGWSSRVAENGRGAVYQRPGAIGNADMVRIMEPTPRYTNGYAVVHNRYGQPVDVFGVPGPRATTHIPESYRGPWPGWPK